MTGWSGAVPRACRGTAILSCLKKCPDRRPRRLRRLDTHEVRFALQPRALPARRLPMRANERFSQAVARRASAQERERFAVRSGLEAGRVLTEAVHELPDLVEKSAAEHVVDPRLNARAQDIRRRQEGEFEGV